MFYFLQTHLYSVGKCFKCCEKCTELPTNELAGIILTDNCRKSRSETHPAREIHPFLSSVDKMRDRIHLKVDNTACPKY